MQTTPRRPAWATPGGIISAQGAGPPWCRSRPRPGPTRVPPAGAIAPRPDVDSLLDAASGDQNRDVVQPRDSAMSVADAGRIGRPGRSRRSLEVSYRPALTSIPTAWISASRSRCISSHCRDWDPRQSGRAAVAASPRSGETTDVCYSSWVSAPASGLVAAGSNRLHPDCRRAVPRPRPPAAH